MWIRSDQMTKVSSLCLWVVPFVSELSVCVRDERVTVAPIQSADDAPSHHIHPCPAQPRIPRSNYVHEGGACSGCPELGAHSHCAVAIAGYGPPRSFSDCTPSASTIITVALEAGAFLTTPFKLAPRQSPRMRSSAKTVGS